MAAKDGKDVLSTRNTESESRWFFAGKKTIWGIAL
jgi:hypothetical protein